MSSEKAPNKKRANAPLRSDLTKQFAKDWERIRKAGRQDLGRAKEGLMLLIADDGPLPPQFSDHALTGDWSNHREFHAGGDLLVIYLVKTKEREILFVRIGTHVDLFE